MNAGYVIPYFFRDLGSKILLREVNLSLGVPYSIPECRCFSVYNGFYYFPFSSLRAQISSIDIHVCLFKSLEEEMNKYPDIVYNNLYIINASPLVARNEIASSFLLFITLNSKCHL